MARHVGLTVIHPGGYHATEQLLHSLNVRTQSKVLDVACGKGTSALRIFSRYLTDGEVRRRMNLITETFREYPQYFGYGTYSFTKN